MVESGCYTKVGAEAEGQSFNRRAWAGSRRGENVGSRMVPRRAGPGRRQDAEYVSLPLGGGR